MTKSRADAEDSGNQDAEASAKKQSGMEAPEQEAPEQEAPEQEAAKQEAPEQLVPISIERNGDAAISIRWSDGGKSEWTVARLRKACPCASCREKQRGLAVNSEEEDSESPKKLAMLPVLSIAEAQPLRIESMSPVGAYAYNIAFSDGHSSGIFPMALLRDREPA